MEDKMSAAQIAAELGSDLEKGLSIEQAHERIHSRGRNKIRLPKAKRRLGEICRSMVCVMNTVLIFTAVVHLLCEGVHGIFLSVCLGLCALINGIVGYINFNRGSEIPHIAEIWQKNVRVIRSGIEKEINAQLLAQGDVIILEKGDVSPADAAVISCENLIVDESVINGGEASVVKGNMADGGANRLYMGSKILTGSVKAIVTDVGEHTLLGSAVDSLSGGSKGKTAFAKRMERIGNIFGVAAVVMYAAAFALRLYAGKGVVSALDNSTAAALAAVPVSLSAVLLASTAADARRMRRNGIKLAGVSAMEALGSATVLCVGKRGILTELGFKVGELRPGKDFGENRLRLLGAMCTTVDPDKDAAKADPIQLALVNEALENSITLEDIRLKAPVCRVIDSRSVNNTMTTVHKRGNGFTVITKGAPEAVLGCCSYIYDGGTRLLNPNEDIAKIIGEAQQMAEKAMTVMGIAYKDVNDIDSPNSAMTFAGLVGFVNPLRADTASAVKRLEGMGVKVCVITDDKMISATAVAEECGIGRENVLSGAEAYEKGITKIKATSVLAETPVGLKAAVVEMINSKRENVAVAGRSSKDILAMSKGEVSLTTKESAAVCVSGAGVNIEGSGLGKIADALRECRRTFVNNERITGYLLSCSIVQMVCALISLALGYSTPFSPMAILWLNVLVASVGAAAIRFEPYHGGISEITKDSDKIKSGHLSSHTSAAAVIRGIIGGGAIMLMYAAMIGKTAVEDVRFAVFAALCVNCIFAAQSCRSDKPIYKRLGKNKAAWACIAIQLCISAAAVLFARMRSVLHLGAMPNFGAAAIGAAAALAAGVVMEILKALSRPKKAKKRK